MKEYENKLKHVKQLVSSQETTKIMKLTIWCSSSNLCPVQDTWPRASPTRMAPLECWHWKPIGLHVLLSCFWSVLDLKMNWNFHTDKEPRLPMNTATAIRGWEGSFWTLALQMWALSRAWSVPKQELLRDLKMETSLQRLTHLQLLPAEEALLTP